MEIRLAKNEDLDDLKKIWKLCFGDPDLYIDLYFQRCGWTGETALLARDGKAVSMLAMIPVGLVDGKGEECSASMIFAVATHPDYQKQGLADRLIEYANQYLFSKGIAVTLLVPAGEDLFRFYGKRGYQNGFFVREAVLKRNDIEKLGRDGQGKAERLGRCRIVSAEPSEYNNLRDRLLKGHPHLAYRVDEIEFEKRIAVTFGTDIYAIEFAGRISGNINDNSGAAGAGSMKFIAEGCAYAERISPEQVVVKELLVSEEKLVLALKCITEHLPAEEYFIRTPAHSGRILGGTVRPFGMLRANSTEGKEIITDACSPSVKSYLGIAYD